MKTIEITNIYAVLNEAKLTKMDDADKFKVIKALRVIKPVAKGYEDFVEDVKNKLKGDDHDKMTEKAQAWNKDNQGKKVNELTQEQIDELNTINTYFAEYNKRVETCLKEEAEKEVELTFDKLSEEAFSKLVASNDWTCGQIMALSDAVAE